MRKFLLLSLGGVIIIVIPLVAFSFVQANPGPGAPAHWSAARNISNSSVGISGPRMAAQGNGILHLIWVDLSPAIETGNLLYKKSEDQGSSWTNAEQVTSEEESWPGNITPGPDGTVHVIWIERESFQSHSVEYAAKVNGGGWVTSTVAAPALQQEPALAVESDYVHAVWSWRPNGNFSIYYSQKAIMATQWPTTTFPTYIYSSTPMSGNPDIALDSSGNVHAVWQEGSVQGTIYIYYSRTEDGGITWTPPITVTQGIADSRSPTIAIGADDRVHVVWGRYITNAEQYVGYVNFSNNITTTDIITPTTISETVVSVSAAIPYNVAPAMAISGTDEIHIAWHGAKPGDAAEEIYYTYSEDGGQNWSTPVNISRDPTSVSIAPGIALLDNMIHVVWQGKDEGGKYQVMYSHGFPYAIYVPMVMKDY